MTARLYRSTEQKIAIAALEKGESLLLVGEQGCGKTHLAKSLIQAVEAQNIPSILLNGSNSLKEFVAALAEAVGLDPYTETGSIAPSTKLRPEIEALYRTKSIKTAPIIDNAHSLTKTLREWLSSLLDLGVRTILLATRPPNKDIFRRLPRIELEPLPEDDMRDLMLAAAQRRSLTLTPATLADLLQRVGGNPQLAVRVVQEEYLQLQHIAPDHTRFIDATPFVLAIAGGMVMLRYIGLGTGNQNLYLLGGMSTAFIIVFRGLLYQVPKRGSRL